MIVLAHAGHWAVQLIYLFPLAVLVGVIIAGRIRDRRAGDTGHENDRDDSAGPAGDGRRRSM